MVIVKIQGKEYDIDPGFDWEIKSYALYIYANNGNFYISIKYPDDWKKSAHRMLRSVQKTVNDKYQFEMQNQNAKLEERLLILEKELAEIKETLYYMPPTSNSGGQGYMEAKADYEKNMKK